MIEVKYCDFKDYGRCVSISNGKTVIKITTEVGPRVIYLGFTDGDNIMYEDVDDNVNQGGKYFDDNFKEGEKWHIYGGHRLWKSPEDWSTYAPDNYPVEVEFIENGAVFTSDVEKMTGLRKSIAVSMNAEGEITLAHKFVNKGDKAIKCALWGLSVMNKGGVTYIPLSTEDTGWLANRNIVFWSYSDVKDDRLDIRQDAVVLRQDPAADKNIKIGVNTPYGIAYYRYKDKLFEKKFDVAKGGNYPDFSCDLEAYTSEYIMEIESLSELTTIEPGEERVHTEKWRVYDDKSGEYARISSLIG